jgi:hypothetical protein
MNFKIIASLASITGGLLLGGCASTEYPVTYQIPIGYSQVSSAYGIQNLNVSHTHDVDVKPGVPFFYQVISPVSLTLYVFDKTDPDRPGGILLSTMQGTTLTSSVTPRYDTLEFVFSASQPYTAGTAQFTISDGPIAAPVMAATTMQSSTTTTVVAAPAPILPPGSSTTTTVTTPAGPPTQVMQTTTTTNP